MLALIRGGVGDPGPRAVAAQGLAFRSILEFSPPVLMPWLRKCWMRCLVTMQEKARRWAGARGPISATVATLLDGGWKPIAPGAWLHPSGNDFLHVADPLCPNRVIKDVLEGVEQKRLWSEAAGFRYGRLLCHGIDTFAMDKVLSSIRRKGGVGLHGAALCAASSGSWTQARLFECGLASSPKCPTCLYAIESEAHRYWACPANAAIDDAVIASTQHLCSRALRECEQLPQLWFRGLRVPGTDGQPEVTELVQREWHASPDAGRAGRVIASASDGSGGDFGSDPRLRRCGAAAVLVLDSPRRGDGAAPAFRLGHCVASTVPGLQTTGRAEIYGCILAVRLILASRCDTLGTVLYHFTDDLTLVRIGQYLSDGGSLDRECVNFDLYALLQLELRRLKCKLAFRKIKAHVDQTICRASSNGSNLEAPLFGGDELSPAGVFGNQACDVLAAINSIEVSEVLCRDLLCESILFRLARIDIACGLVPRVGLLPRKEAHSASLPGTRRNKISQRLREALSTTRHLVRHRSKRAVCARCRGGAAFGRVIGWLRSPCLEDAPCPVPPHSAHASITPFSGTHYRAAVRTSRDDDSWCPASEPNCDDPFPIGSSGGTPAPKCRLVDIAIQGDSDAKKRRVLTRRCPPQPAISEATEAAVVISGAATSSGSCGAAGEGAGWCWDDRHLSGVHRSHAP